MYLVYLGLVWILLIKFKWPWLIIITLTDVILIILLWFILCRILLVYEYTSGALLDPMTDEGRPNMKHFIFIVKITVDIFVYDSGDVINWIIGSPYKLYIRLAE